MPKSIRKVSKEDVQQAHYLRAITDWKSGNKEQFLYSLSELVSVCVAKYSNSGEGGTIEPKCTGNDVSQEVYVTLLRWLYQGKGVSKTPQSAYSILKPAAIRKLARNIGFSGYKYPVQVGTLEDYSPIDWDVVDEQNPLELEEETVSVFRKAWESFYIERFTPDFLERLRSLT